MRLQRLMVSNQRQHRQKQTARHRTAKPAVKLGARLQRTAASRMIKPSTARRHQTSARRTTKAEARGRSGIWMT